MVCCDFMKSKKMSAMRQKKKYTSEEALQLIHEQYDSE